MTNSSKSQKKMFELHSIDNNKAEEFDPFLANARDVRQILVGAFNFLFHTIYLFLHFCGRFSIYFGVIHNTTKVVNQMVYVGLVLILVLMSRKSFYKKINWSLWCVHMSANMMVMKSFTQEKYESIFVLILFSLSPI